MKQLIECVPNFSEGRDRTLIKQITDCIESVEGVKLLNVDPGKATNRTVVTFVGEPNPVIEAAFLAIRKAAEIIDMSSHKGEHPRMGATDVCPLIPVANITMDETVDYAKKLAERVGKEINIPVYLYESAQSNAKRKNLSVIRAGEYEGFFRKILQPEWKPDFGPAEFNAKSGATVIGARDFLVAYNVNLNTTSVRRANSVAFDVRENGRKVKNEKGEEVIQPGACKSVKAIGWFIEEYGIAQVSMNLTNLSITPLHIAFNECEKSAISRGMRVTGSEIVGLLPLKALTDAGKFFIERQNRSSGVSERELVRIAVKSLGLNELSEFNPDERIIEYVLRDLNDEKLVRMSLTDFADETASESPAPGGGTISAYAGALGVSLATMVANLSAGKKGWEDRWKIFSDHASRGQQLKKILLGLADEDTKAFNRIMDAFGLPKSTDTEKKERADAIEDATKYAIEIPLKVMKYALESMNLIESVAENGNPNSVSDAGVGALCARTAVLGAYLNVRINASGIKNEDYKSKVLNEAREMHDQAIRAEEKILRIVEKKIA